MSQNSPLNKSSFVSHRLQIILSIIAFGGWLPIYAGYYLYCSLTGSTIEERKSKRVTKIEKRREKRTALKNNRLITRKLVQESKARGFVYKSNIGYKKGNFVSGQTYGLECSHQIRARKQTGLISRGMIGKTVWCDVCKANRTVIGSVWHQH